MSSSRFISAAKSEQLIDKLTSMASEYEKTQIVPRIYTDNRIKANNPHLYYIMDKQITAVQKKMKVSFQYGEYDINKNFVRRNDGELQEVELLCDNELMKYVIDKFGAGIKVEKVSEGQFRTTVSVVASKTFYEKYTKTWLIYFRTESVISSILEYNTVRMELVL